MMPKESIRRSRRGYSILTMVMAVALCLCGVQATSEAGQPGPLVTSPEGPATAATSPAGESAVPASPSVEGYASREASAKGLENFKGGDVVIIGSTGLILVLLIILIIILV